LPFVDKDRNYCLVAETRGAYPEAEIVAELLLLLDFFLLPNILLNDALALFGVSEPLGMPVCVEFGADLGVGMPFARLLLPKSE